MKRPVQWNNQVKLIISDVDETIAGIYKDASDEMICELEHLLADGIVLFFISGQSFDNINKRLAGKIRPQCRNKILIGACSGTELWGFDKSGNIPSGPFYNLYERILTDEQKKEFRNIVRQIISEFKLVEFPAMPVEDFRRISNRDPLSVMIADRDSQITLEIANAYNLSPGQALELRQVLPGAGNETDLRIPIMRRSKELLSSGNIPISCRLAGVFAVDYATECISKSTAVNFILKSKKALYHTGLDGKQIIPFRHIEVWGDRFSTVYGTDYLMSICLPREVRSISFRPENPDEFPKGYNILLWDGKYHLHEGLLEYLKHRDR